MYRKLFDTVTAKKLDHPALNEKKNKQTPEYILVNNGVKINSNGEGEGIWDNWWGKLEKQRATCTGMYGHMK